MNLFPKATLLALVATIFLAGCQGVNQASNQETESPSPTAVETEPPAAELPSTSETDGLAGVSARISLELFEAVAELSCETALDQGITEKAIDGSVTMVMVSEQDAIESYSAAYLETGPPKNYVLIFEADMFVACGAHFSFVLARDADTEVKIAAQLEPDGSFFVVQDFGEFGVQGQSYLLEDGLFKTVSTTFGEEIRVTDLVYGKPLSEDLQILQIAFDQFFG